MISITYNTDYIKKMLDGAAAYCVRNSWVIGLGVCIQHHCHYIPHATLLYYINRDMNSLNIMTIKI